MRCGDVERHFPLPGRFHFRFKKKFRDAFGESGQVGRGGLFTLGVLTCVRERIGGGLPSGVCKRIAASCRGG